VRVGCGPAPRAADVVRSCTLGIVSAANTLRVRLVLIAAGLAHCDRAPAPAPTAPSTTPTTSVSATPSPESVEPPPAEDTPAPSGRPLTRTGGGPGTHVGRNVSCYSRSPREPGCLPLGDPRLKDRLGVARMPDAPGPSDVSNCCYGVPDGTARPVGRPLWIAGKARVAVVVAGQGWG
jgi:hypothetical protein